MKTYTAQVMITYTTYKSITVEFEASKDDDLEAMAEEQACNELCKKFGDLGDIEYVEVSDLRKK